MTTPPSLHRAKKQPKTVDEIIRDAAHDTAKPERTVRGATSHGGMRSILRSLPPEMVVREADGEIVIEGGEGAYARGERLFDLSLIPGHSVGVLLAQYGIDLACKALGCTFDEDFPFDCVVLLGCGTSFPEVYKLIERKTGVENTFGVDLLNLLHHDRAR